MLLYGILASFLVLFLALGAIVQYRDAKRHRHWRESEEMWREDVREQARDMRASHGVHNVIDPDLSWTDWGRRNRPRRR